MAQRQTVFVIQRWADESQGESVRKTNEGIVDHKKAMRIFICSVVGSVAVGSIGVAQTTSPASPSGAQQGTAGQSELYVEGDEASIKGRETVEYKLTSFRSRQSKPGMLSYNFSATDASGAKLDGMFGFNITGDFMGVTERTVELLGKGTFVYGRLVNGELSGSGAVLAGKSKPVPVLAIEWNGHDLPPKKIWVEGTPLMLFVLEPGSILK